MMLACRTLAMLSLTTGVSASASSSAIVSSGSSANHALNTKSKRLRRDRAFKQRALRPDGSIDEAVEQDDRDFYDATTASIDAEGRVSSVVNEARLRRERILLRSQE